MNINQTGHIPGIDAAQMPWKGGFMNVAFRIGVCDVTVTQFIIGVCSVTQQQFRDLMSELLVDGITKERIIVLFFFCADVAISILKYVTETDSVDLCNQFLRWSISFITERICSWVQENGGWGAIFNSSLRYLRNIAIVGFFGLAVYFGVRKFARQPIS